MRPDQIRELAEVIYAARFADAPPRDVTPFADLPGEAQEAWFRCARAAGVSEAKRNSRIARMHGHHALWFGLIPAGWSEVVEQFGRGLAARIEASILNSGESN